MEKNKLFYYLVFMLISLPVITLAQNEEQNKILYFQMEPLNDSLFIKIQKEVYVNPPDPKAEIIVDLRDPNNETVSIKGTLYPFLAFTPKTRAQIITYPFKIDLANNITFISVFTNVFNKMNFHKFFSPPTKYEISSTLGYINPFLQLFGGERFGIPIKGNLGFSFGIGTPYSAPLETNFIEANFNILGFSAGFIGSDNSFIEIKRYNNHNNLYVTLGYQFGYVIPFGNFFKLSYIKIIKKPTPSLLTLYHRYDILGYHAKVLNGSYVNWEFRYPISVLGSTRGKFYIARYVDEWHIGFTGRELSLGGSTFDFSFDAMPISNVRQPQYEFNILVQKFASDWAFSAFAIGPSFTLSKTNKGDFGLLSIFLNMRIKVGTSF